MKRAWLQLALCVWLALGCGGAVVAQTAPAAPARKLGEIWFEPVKTQIDGQPVEAELGRLMVKENRSKAGSNLIELAFMRLKSTAAQPGYPVIYLDGGPGSSAIALARLPEYFRAFQKMREVGDVILLDQRGVGSTKPNLARISMTSLPRDVFADKAIAERAFTERAKEAAQYFRDKGVDILAYNTVESAHDVDDLRKALGVPKVNLVGFSYGTHLGLAVLRYHSANLNRVVLIGTEGPNHTYKLPSTSDLAMQRLARLAAADAVIGKDAPDLVGSLRRVLARLDKEPAVVTVTDRKTKQPVDLKIGKFGLQMLMLRDLGDTNDLPIFPAWIVTMERGDYSILKHFAERRYNEYGQGISVMTLVMDYASGATKDRFAQIARETPGSLFGEGVNFPFPGVGAVLGEVDLGDEFRGPLKTNVPTLFISGVLDNNTQPFQADEVRRPFKQSTHLIIENAGHESMLTEARVQQTLVDYLRGQDVRAVKIALPPLRFRPIPARHP